MEEHLVESEHSEGQRHRGVRLDGLAPRVRRAGPGGARRSPPSGPVTRRRPVPQVPRGGALTHKRHILPHSAQPRHTNGAPRTRKRHQQKHRPQRPTERSDPTQHSKGRTGDCPGARKETKTRRNVTQGGGGGALLYRTSGGARMAPALADRRGAAAHALVSSPWSSSCLILYGGWGG